MKRRRRPHVFDGGWKISWIELFVGVQSFKQTKTCWLASKKIVEVNQSEIFFRIPVTMISVSTCNQPRKVIILQLFDLIPSSSNISSPNRGWKSNRNRVHNCVIWHQRWSWTVCLAQIEHVPWWDRVERERDRDGSYECITLLVCIVHDFLTRFPFR